MASFHEQMADFARAELLRELRDGRHLSRERVAADIGVSTKTLYAWEHGGKIKWENAQKIAAFYKVDPERLVSRNGDEEDSEPLPLEAEGLADQIISEVKAALLPIERRLASIEGKLSALPGPPADSDLGQALADEKPKSGTPRPGSSRTPPASQPK